MTEKDGSLLIQPGWKNSFQPRIHKKFDESKPTIPKVTLILRESVMGLKGRPFSCTLTLNGAPLRTTRALALLKSFVLCVFRFSDSSRLTYCILKSARRENILDFARQKILESKQISFSSKVNCRKYTSKRNHRRNKFVCLKPPETSPSICLCLCFSAKLSAPSVTPSSFI